MSDKRQDVPIGLEKVLYTAAQDQAFRERLFVDREAAVKERGLKLRPSELALLRAVPEAQLRGAIENIDTSQANLKRRVFMRAVAATAATVVAADVVGGCGTEASDGIRPDMPDAGPKDAAPETAEDSAGGEETVDISQMDTGLDALASNGIRPQG
jgi:hypothetical protein